MSEPTSAGDATTEVEGARDAADGTRRGATIPAQPSAPGATGSPIALPEQAAGSPQTTSAETVSAVEAAPVEESSGEPPHVFPTPDWVATPRTQNARRALEQLLPQQTDPEHDHLATHAHAPRQPEVVERGHWVGPRTGRAVVGTVVLIFLAGAAYGGVQVAATHSTSSIVLTLVCVLFAAGVFALMATDRPMVVDLEGTTLTVRHAHGRDRFELADPFQEVATRGEPGTTGWTLSLGRPEGTVLVVDGQTVDSAVLAPVVARARILADRRRSARDSRFNR